MTKIMGYHTCKANGTWGFIWSNAPFLSQNNPRQWLTQGYYFWTDTDYFAHKWGKSSIAGEYAIIQCLIEIKRDLLLDLVGDVNDQLYFQKLVDTFHQRLVLADSEAKSPTVNAVLSFYRCSAATNKAIFPYIAIKAVDQYSEKKVSFIEHKNECLSLLTRQQLCLFDLAVNCIKTKEPIYPDQFKSAINKIGVQNE